MFLFKIKFVYIVICVLIFVNFLIYFELKFKNDRYNIYMLREYVCLIFMLIFFIIIDICY